MEKDNRLYLAGNPDSDGKDFLYFKIQLNGKRAKIFTPVKVTANKWNQKDQYSTASRIENDKVSVEKQRLKDAISLLKFQRNLNFDNLKKAYEENINRIKREPIEKKLSFIAAFDLFQELNKKRYSADYLRKYKATKDDILLFQKYSDFSHITNSWLTNFYSYLLDKELSANTIYDKFKCIKQVMQLAEDQNINVPKAYKSFTVSQEEMNHVTLNKNDLKKLEKVETFDLKEELVKDMFLFRCYTGIRFQNLKSMNIENLKDGMHPFYIPKAKKNHSIAISPKAKAILTKYGSFNFKDFGPNKIKHYYSQMENEIIKSLCSRAKINDIFYTKESKGTKVDMVGVPKHTKVSSHTARRTWAKLAYEKGWDILTISRFLGHSDTQITMRYLNIENDDFKDLPTVG